MYKITEYTLNKAKQIGVTVKPSAKANKKIDVFKSSTGEYVCSVGAYGMSDYPTYINTHGLEYANERRKLFYKRFNNIEKGTPTWYSAKLLW